MSGGGGGGGILYPIELYSQVILRLTPPTPSGFIWSHALLHVKSALNLGMRARASCHGYFRAREHVIFL